MQLDRSARKYRPTTTRLFVHDNGVPYKFWVHPKLEDRKRVVRAIQTHGGIVLPENNLAPATYAVVSQEMSTEDLESVRNDPWYTIALSYKWVIKSVRANRLVDDRPHILWSRCSDSTPSSYKSLEPDADSEPWWLSRYFGQIPDSNSESLERRAVLLEPFSKTRVIPSTARIRPRRKRLYGQLSSSSSPTGTTKRTMSGSDSTYLYESSLVYPTTTDTELLENDVHVLDDSSGTSPPSLRSASYHALHSVWITRKDGSKVRKFSSSKMNGNNSTSSSST